MRRLPQLSVLGLYLAACALLLTGCIPSNLNYLSNPRFPEGGVRQLIHFAFLKPWILLPAMWNAIWAPTEEGFFGGLVHGFTVTFFVFFVGGVHVGLGFLMYWTFDHVCKRTSGLVLLVGSLLRSCGGLMLLYGIFIWLSGLGALIGSFVASVW